MTSGTYGQHSSTSLKSASLSTFLASRLQQVTQTHGSTLYRQTWKEWDTPSGLRRLRQRASVRRTSEKELTGWPTPTASNNDRSPSMDRAMSMYRPDGSKAQQRTQDFAAICGPLRLTVFGVMQTGYFVEMAAGAQLNPAHSRWLQGLPKTWDTASPHYEHWLAATELAD